MDADLRRLNGAPPFGSGSLPIFSDSPIATGFALGTTDRLNGHRRDTDRGGHLKVITEAQSICVNLRSSGVNLNLLLRLQKTGVTGAACLGDGHLFDGLWVPAPFFRLFRR
jgi:hypothetical protein